MHTQRLPSPLPSNINTTTHIRKYTPSHTHSHTHPNTQSFSRLKRLNNPKLFFWPAHNCGSNRRGAEVSPGPLLRNIQRPPGFRSKRSLVQRSMKQRNNVFFVGIVYPFIRALLAYSPTAENLSALQHLVRGGKLKVEGGAEVMTSRHTCMWSLPTEWCWEEHIHRPSSSPPT